MNTWGEMDFIAEGDFALNKSFVNLGTLLGTNDDAAHN